MDTQTFRRYVRILAYQAHCEPDQAEDALQTAYLQMMEKQAKGEIIQDEGAFLLTVGKRRHYDRCRKESFLGEVADYGQTKGVTADDPAQQFAGEEHPEILRELSAGESITDIAERHNTTRWLVYGIRDRWLED